MMKRSPIFTVGFFLTALPLNGWVQTEAAQKCKISVYKNFNDKRIAESFQEEVDVADSRQCREVALKSLQKYCSQGTTPGEGTAFANSVIVGQPRTDCKYDPPTEDELIRTFLRFSNTRYTEEHAWGMDVELWKYRGKLVGILTWQAGLQGSPHRGVLKDLNYDPQSGALAFQSTVTLGDTKRTINFSGKIRGSRLVGQLDPPLPMELSATGQSVLKRKPWDKEWDPPVARYSEWEKRWKPIILEQGGDWYN